MLCQNRLPPVPRPRFDPKDFPRGDGILTPEAANYLLSVMVHGGTLVIAGTTGSGKTFVGQRILQEMLDYYPRGAIREHSKFVRSRQINWLQTIPGTAEPDGSSFGSCDNAS